MSAQPCYGLAGLLFGHSYEPRYSLGAPSLKSLTLGSGNPVPLLEATKPKTYHGDVCSRCGHVIGAKP